MIEGLQPDVAVVVSASRRFVQLLTDQDEIVRGTVASAALKATVGDLVRYEREEKRRSL